MVSELSLSSSEQYNRGDFEVLSFGPRVFRADLKIFVKQIADLDSLWKNTQIQKKK